MPVFKSGAKLIYYAHVPKCGGSALAWYLRERFGHVAFSDTRHTRHDPASLWSRSSPQHIDAKSLGRLFPPGFFDATFTVVRHPVPRLVSAYHFQLEVEKCISEQVTFTDWLQDIEELLAENPFAHDNHIRPMSDIAPADAQVFHMEHGLDALIPWLDTITGEQATPRAIPKMNAKGEYSGTSDARVQPSDHDLELIARTYAADFTRFGYDPKGTRKPVSPAPALPDGFAAERDAALQQMNKPLNRLRSKIGARLRG